jgi:hypothetical protein
MFDSELYSYMLCVIVTVDGAEVVCVLLTGLRKTRVRASPCECACLCMCACVLKWVFSALAVLRCACVLEHEV